MQGLCLALADWSAELRILRGAHKREKPPGLNPAAAVHASALELMSDENLVVLEEMAVLRAAGQEIEQTLEWEAVVARYDEACMTALAKQTVRFTISEMDELLEAE